MRRYLLPTVVLIVLVMIPSAAFADSYSDAVDVSAPAAYWKLDESTGTTAADASGDGHGGTYYGTPSLGQAPATGDRTSITLGTSQYVSIPHDTVFDSPTFTVEAWIKPTVGAVGIASTRDACSSGWLFMLSGSNVEFAFDCGNGGFAITNDTVPFGSWSHVAATYDGTRIRIYINGREASSYMYDVRGTPTIASSQPLTIGATDQALLYGSAQWWQGGIDEVAYYSGVLDGVELYEHAHSLGPDAPPNNIDSPSAHGSILVGHDLTATSGTWTGSPTSLAYEWSRCDSAGSNCVSIPGATSSTYHTVPADVGSKLRVRVSATNAHGTGTVDSAAYPAIVNSTDTYSGAVLSDNPIAYWGLDDTTASTTTLDLAGDGHDGTYQGSAAPGAAGIVGSAVSLNGSGAFVSVPYTASLNPTSFTVEAWIRPNTGGKTIISTRKACTTGWLLMLSGTNVEFAFDCGSGGFAITDQTVPTNAWSYVVATYDGAQIHIYINGQEATYQYNVHGTPVVNSTEELTIGTDSYTRFQGGSAWWNGLIDEPALYDHALSAQHVLQHYEMGIGAPVNTVYPTISGFTAVGEEISVNHGSWIGDPTFAYQWQRCDWSGSECTDISGSAGSSYTVAAGDFGHVLKAVVHASNVAGETYAIVNASVATNPVAQLADEYRPALLFDSHEGWRPLDVDQMLSDDLQYGTGDLLCTRGTTDPVPCPGWAEGTADLDGPWSIPAGAGSYIDEAGSADNGADSASPNPLCQGTNEWGTPLRDCNAGSATAIYYHVGQDAQGFRYIDYWIYYRYNDVNETPFNIAQGSADDHEGDWEGLTVVLDARTNAQPKVAGAIYAQHKDVTWAFPSDLEEVRDGVKQPLGTPPNSPTHVVAYVAEGTHASYAVECHSDIGHCQNPQWPNHLGGENNHDGLAAWGPNDDQTNCGCVQPLPSAEDSWTFWPGQWGADQAHTIPTGDTVGASPHSPGDPTQYRFACTEAGWQCGHRPTDMTLAAASDPKDTKPVVAPQFCESWIGPETAAVACDPVLLKKTIRQHRMAVRGPFHIHVKDHSSGDTIGLAHALGSLLWAGDKVYLDGTATSRMVLLLRATDGRHVFTLRVLHLNRARHAVVSVIRTQKGLRAVWRQR